MQPSATPPQHLVDDLRARTQKTSVSRVALDLGVSRTTISKLCKGLPCDPAILVKMSSTALPNRTRADFPARPAFAGVKPRVRENGVYAWDLESIRNARNMQFLGDFRIPVMLAEAMRADDAIFNARLTRLQPLASLATQLTAAPGARGEGARKAADRSALVQRTVLSNIAATLVDHGVAIGFIAQTPRDDGSAVDFVLTEWPLHAVKYNHSTEQLEAFTAGGGTIPIVHADGTWIIFRRFHARPWVQDASILPLALAWAGHSNGIGDWASASRAHGIAKVMGELPEGVGLGEDGKLSPEAAAFLAVLNDLVNGDASAGIRPAGAKTDFLSNGSSAWQVFAELISNRERAITRVYLGTDAILGANSGTPGVDIATLFGVATTKLQGDIGAIEDGLSVGFFKPWAAINRGSSDYAPRLQFMLPDPDADAKRAEQANNRTRLHDALDRMILLGLYIDQDVVNTLAAEYGVTPAPHLAPKPAAAGTPAPPAVPA